MAIDTYDSAGHSILYVPSYPSQIYMGCLMFHMNIFASKNKTAGKLYAQAHKKSIPAKTLLESCTNNIIVRVRKYILLNWSWVCDTDQLPTHIHSIQLQGNS